MKIPTEAQNRANLRELFMCLRYFVALLVSISAYQYGQELSLWWAIPLYVISAAIVMPLAHELVGMCLIALMIIATLLNPFRYLP